VMIHADDPTNPTTNEIVGLVVGEFEEGRGVIACHMHRVVSALEISLDV